MITARIPGNENIPDVDKSFFKGHMHTTKRTGQASRYTIKNYVIVVDSDSRYLAAYKITNQWDPKRLAKTPQFVDDMFE